MVLPFKITDQPSLLVYLGGAERLPILRDYVDENPIEEDHNLEEDQQDMLNDEFDAADMNNQDDKIGKDEVLDFESNNPPTPIIGSNNPASSQSSRGIEHVKSNIRGTYEHRYAVLNAYRYMLEVANPGSKTALSLDENGRFKYFFVSYAAWITSLQEVRKVIAIDETFLRSKYEGGLLSAVAQDAENHIFSVAFCVVDKKCDASYEFFFQNMRSFVDDTDELCIISDRYPSIRKMVSTIYPASHYGCCMRHLGENIRNKFHNSKSRAFCPGNRYNIMTSNITESVNVMFDVERKFPIVALFDEINRRFALLFTRDVWSW
ncbi:hypothetical protein KY290_005731 [Solanum tuberosum]|uniref:MULE transposase domain-containing protein n=1 Tax=Solanum tuberosum TaxID=4113 RepID=A0ABQ7WF12_SOLTU|nr:hypothetical protein KY290_005731 [Solanum tuberosum]